MAFDPTKIGAEFRYNDGNLNVGVNSTPIVPYNPYRVYLLLYHSGTGVTVRPVLGAVSAAQLNLTANTGPQVFTLQNSGPLCQQAWNGAMNGGAQVYFLEVLWVPPGG